MEITIEIKGDVREAIEKNLAILRKKIIDVLTEATSEAYATAKELVPIRTGNLYRSIHIEKVSPFEHKVVAGHPIKEKGKPYYAPFVEYGTRKMSPRPYMRPAMEKAIQVIKSKFKE